MNHMEKARALRARTDVHFNCCQSVLAAFAEDMGLTEEQAYNLGANFGSGMRCGAVCGALTGALMRSSPPPSCASSGRTTARSTAPPC